MTEGLWVETKDCFAESSTAPPTWQILGPGSKRQSESRTEVCVPCYSHSLNLVAKRAAGSCLGVTELQITFTKCTHVYTLMECAEVTSTAKGNN